MKKILFLLLASLIVSNCASYVATASTTASTTANTYTSVAQSMMTTLKDTVTNDIKNTVTSSVNSIKLETYKSQLAAKQKELQDVENSSSFALIKNIRTIFINQKIAELEANIKAIESTTTTTETK